VLWVVAAFGCWIEIVFTSALQGGNSHTTHFNTVIIFKNYIVVGCTGIPNG